MAEGEGGEKGEEEEEEEKRLIDLGVKSGQVRLI